MTVNRHTEMWTCVLHAGIGAVSTLAVLHPSAALSEENCKASFSYVYPTKDGRLFPSVHSNWEVTVDGDCTPAVAHCRGEYRAEVKYENDAGGSAVKMIRISWDNRNSYVRVDPSGRVMKGNFGFDGAPYQLCRQTTGGCDHEHVRDVSISCIRNPVTLPARQER